MPIAAHPAAVLASRPRVSAPNVTAPAPTPTVTAPQARAVSVIGGAVKPPGLQF